MNSPNLVWQRDLEDEQADSPFQFVADDKEILGLTHRMNADDGKVIGTLPMRACCRRLTMYPDSGDALALLDGAPKADPGLIALNPARNRAFICNPSLTPSGSIVVSITNHFDTLSRWRGGASPVRAAFSADGALATASVNDGQLALWREEYWGNPSDFTPWRWPISRRTYQSLQLASGGVSAMSFKNGSQMLALGFSDGTAEAFNYAEAESAAHESARSAAPYLYRTLPHCSAILGVSMLDDNRLIVLCYDGSVAEWYEPSSADPSFVLRSFEDEHLVGFSSSGRTLLGKTTPPEDSSTTINPTDLRLAPLWSLTDGTRRNWWLSAEANASERSRDFLDDDTLVSWTSEKVIKSSLSDGDTKEFSIRDASRTGIKEQFLTRTGKLVASGYQSGTEIVLFDIHSGQRAASLVTAAPLRTFLPNRDHSQALTVETNNLATLWDLESGTRVSQTGLRSDDATPLAFSKDGQRILILETVSKIAKIWDAKSTGGPLTSGNVPWASEWDRIAKMPPAEISPDLEHCCYWSSGRAVLAGTLSSQADHPLDHLGVIAASFSPDSRVLATASSDGQVRFWDTRTGNEAWLPLVLGASPRNLLFSPDGRYLVVHCHRELQVWRLDSSEHSDQDWARIAAFFSSRASNEESPQPLFARVGAAQIRGNANSRTMAQRWQELRLTLQNRPPDEGLIPEFWLQRSSADAEGEGSWDEAAVQLGDLLKEAPQDLDIRIRRANAALMSVLYHRLGNISGKLQSRPESAYREQLEMALGDLQFVSENARCRPSDREKLRRSLQRSRAIPLALLGRRDEADRCQFDGLGIALPPPDRDPQCLDLGAWFTHALPEGVVQPASLSTNVGITFDLRGRIRTAAGHLDEPGDLPSEVIGIPVARSFRRAHFLVGAAGYIGTNSADRTKVARLVIHYVDTQTESIDLRIGDDVREPSPDTGGASETRLSHLVYSWSISGENDRTRAYDRPWENPRPEIEVASIDFVSAMNAVVPVLYAITLEP